MSREGALLRARDAHHLARAEWLLVHRMLLVAWTLADPALAVICGWEEEAFGRLLEAVRELRELEGL